jgi:hypothetical protein
MRSSSLARAPFTPRLIPHILGIVIAAFANLPISAQTYDAEDDFSTVSNPSPGGIWTYGWSDDLNSPLVLYDHLVPNPQYDIWHDPDNTNPTFLTPLVQHNPNDTFSGPHPPHSLSLHPSEDGDYSHVRFTAPAAGSYSITAAFSAISGASTDVHILVNNALPTLFSGFVAGPDGDEFTSRTPIALAVGDTIDFAVGYLGDFLSDSTRLEATITLIDACPADIAPDPDGNDAVDVDDLIAVILAWGDCPPPAPPEDNCLADINNDDTVDVDDLIAVILGWGACP